MVNKKRLVAITLAILMLVMECLSLFSCGTKVENFELSFNVDGENYATITTTGTETIQIPDNPSKDGYTFDGWYWDKDVWSKPFTANSLLDAPISSDMSVYAKFTPIAYSISYEVDGGTHNNPATYTIESSFEFADAQKAGYTFLGWFTDATFATPVKSISAGTTGDMTLYAKFELATYSITYENTKGAENTNPSTYTINSETITFSPLSKDGYTFGGWYVGNTKVIEISSGSTGNLTLTAKWDTISYAIAYHNVIGATNTNPDSYDVEDQPLTLSAASKAGYRFVGWYTDEALTNMVTEIAIGTTGDLNLYAKWEIIEYTATFMDGDTPVGTVKFTVETESITPPAVPEHVGYTGAWENYTLGTEDITINAVYTLITYNIVYHNVEGATNNNPSNYDVEDQPLALLDANKDYYTFKGWYTDAEFNNKVTEIAVGTTGVVNLYAKWEAIEYTATFMDGDTPVGTVKFTVETESIIPPLVPKHTGYIGAWESYALGTENIIIKTVYTVSPFTIGDATNTNIRETDILTPELLGITATNTCGESGNVIISIKSGKQKAGMTMIVTASVTDVEGNVTTKDFEIKVYGTPNVIIKQNHRIIYEDTNLSTLFEIYDTFGNEIDFEVAVSGEQTAGNTIIVTVIVTDCLGNTMTKQYAFGVLPSEKPFVELYVDGNLWQVIFVDDTNDYTLPLPEDNGKNGYNICWGDDNGIQYTDLQGNGVVALPDVIQLHAIKYVHISTEEQLRNISMNGKYLLINNLDLGGVYWNSFGTFKGYFDGGCHTISNFTVRGRGLFSSNKGTIENLGIENFTIVMGSSNSSRSNISYAGGLVGYNEGGIITNCYAKGKINSSSNVSCYSSVSSNFDSTSCSSDSYAGGLVGYNKGGTITNCYAVSNVTSNSSTNVGAYSSFIISISSSSYAGGLVGYNESGTITNCYATGDVSSSSYSSVEASYRDAFCSSYAGGLVGYNNGGTTTNCHSASDVHSGAVAVARYSYGGTSSASSYAGGLVGYKNSGTIADCYATGSVEFNYNNSGTASSDQYSYSYVGGLVGYNNGAIANCYATGDVSSSSGGSYAGGLVGCNSGTITNCCATGDVSSGSGGSYAGGLVGCNSGTITNCYATGNVRSSAVHYSFYAGGLVGYNKGGTITHCYATGNVYSTDCHPIYAGGLVGYNLGKIINCSATGNTSVSYNSSASFIWGYAGGLVGYNGGTIMNCYATGNVRSSTVYYSIYAGGLVAYNECGTITSCYATGNLIYIYSYRSDSSRNGGLVAYDEGGTIINCYCYSGQNKIVTVNGDTTTYSVNTTFGTEIDMPQLQSVTFQTTTLTWSADDWNFVEGQHPTLKNVGTTN